MIDNETMAIFVEEGGGIVSKFEYEILVEVDKKENVEYGGKCGRS